MEEQSHAATCPRVASATCTGWETALRELESFWGMASRQTQLQGLNTGKQGKSQDLNQRMSSCQERAEIRVAVGLIHNKDNFLKLV